METTGRLLCAYGDNPVEREKERLETGTNDRSHVPKRQEDTGAELLQPWPQEHRQQGRGVGV